MKEIIKKSKLQNNEYRFLSKVFSDEIYVVFIDNNFIAISGFCPHFGGPLVLNDDNEFHCYWHDWKFDIVDLKCINNNYKRSLKSYKVRELPESLEIYL